MEQPQPQPQTQTHLDHDEIASAPKRFLLGSLRGLLPNIAFDVGGTLAVYYLLLPHFDKTSLWPILAASMVPLVSNVFSWVRKGRVDVVGIIILLGMAGSAIGLAFGGSQRLLLIRESFITGIIGIALLVSPLVLRKPVGYHVLRHFMAGQPGNPIPFERLWASKGFRRTIRVMTFGWGVLLVAEFCGRVAMALLMPIAFALAVAPLILSLALLIAGAFTAISIGRSIKSALAESA